MDPNNHRDEDVSMTDEQEEIEIILKPMNIVQTTRKEVKMTISKYQLVGDLAQTLLSIMALKDFTAADANFMYSGKMLDHCMTFAEQKVVDQAKIIFTLKRKIVEPKPVPVKVAPVV